MKWFAVLFLVLLSAAGARPQGLFPPFDFSANLALLEPASATSTCGSCQSGGDPACSPACNNTCPHGMQLPASVALLEAAAGEVSALEGEGPESAATSVESTSC